MPNYRYICTIVDGRGEGGPLASKPFWRKNDKEAKKRVKRDMKDNKKRGVTMRDIIIERGSLVTVKKKVFRKTKEIPMEGGE
jgi:hypothetical protein